MRMPAFIAQRLRAGYQSGSGERRAEPDATKGFSFKQESILPGLNRTLYGRCQAIGVVAAIKWVWHSSPSIASPVMHG
jgi:hypothetical protein